MKTLVLASGSLSRKEILESTKYPFTIDISNYEEDMTLNLSPKQLAIFLSKGKAIEVANRHKNAVVLAADSFAVFNNVLLGKPHTPKRAKEMLTLLSGNCHSVITGFTIIDTDTKKEISDAVETKIYFKKLTVAQIDSYLSREDVLLKAGAYSIHGQGKQFVENTEGDYNNVRGLPLEIVSDNLKTFGINLNT